MELVTVGQRRGLGLPGGGEPRYVVDVDVPGATVRVGPEADLLAGGVALEWVVWAAGPRRCRARRWWPSAARTVAPARPRRVRRADRPWCASPPRAPGGAGQSVVLYEGDEVMGGGIAAA